MQSRQRHRVGITLSALLASPVIALFASPAASADADDLATIGPVAIDGYADSLAYNTSTYAFDNLLSGSANLVPFDLDTFYGTPGSGDIGVLLTIPLLYQGGFVDADGTFTPISTFDAADFLNADTGLVDLGGTPPDSLGVESVGPITIGGYSDTFSINTDTLAVDNLLTGSSDSVPFEFDIYSGAPDTASYDAVFTIPSVFQAGFEDIAGTVTPLFSINPADFVSPDLGLELLGGV